MNRVGNLCICTGNLTSFLLSFNNVNVKFIKPKYIKQNEYVYTSTLSTFTPL